MRPETKRAIYVIAALTLVAGGLRFWNLDEPKRKVFDEVYYASDGCFYAGRPHDACGLDGPGESSWVHPPLGKWAIAGGVKVFGNNAIGWRAAPAVAGTASVALAGVLAFLLWGSALWAGLASLLLATEFLNLVQSRVSMLDIFLTVFVLLGFVLLVWDRRRQEDRPPGGIRPLRLLAGVAFGAATAVKWSGLLALAGGIALSVIWMVGRFHAWARDDPGPDPDRARRAWTAESASVALGLVVVPAVVYVLPWLPWIAERGWDLGEWIRQHGAMLDYHWTLETVKENGDPIHPYMSEAWTWLLLLRPVAYFWEGGDDCAAEAASVGCAEILGIGSPLLFWTAVIVVPYLAIAWWVRKDWRMGAILVPIAFQLVPWLVVSRPLFLFYMAPVTPFLALGAAAALRDAAKALMPRRALAVPLVAAVVVVAVLLLAFFWPVLIGQPITYDHWHQRMWFDRWV